MPPGRDEAEGSNRRMRSRTNRVNGVNGVNGVNRVNGINGIGKEPRMRGGGEKSFDQRVLLRRETQHQDGCRADDIEEDYEMPRLRGGGTEPSRVPASLLYLAGSTGRIPGGSITITQWNKMKPKKRMGGLLGIAVYGNKAGKAYIPERRHQEAQTDAGTGMFAAAEVNAE